ncbi:protein FAR1-RELATED SEQUENCE 5-like [Vicia villosa]|uniref:protein FAR1-RELATED SEQUENCE 5-like n=1 Tax=Vicia villosa TaxID=3911 RepID=UPI00273C5146|nr:protein FAR1-RELATED SEQUENCE 5-like [Vicia villosa]
MNQVRRKKLDAGDAQSIFNYCRRKQIDNSNFFYAIQCDDDSRMVNFFWVDARSKLAYQHFGDVITFDTTYKTNKYSMPFAPFTGLNNHCQSILFGCALLQDELESSFTWLFETWLDAMNGKKPISIITDQDLAIKAALAKVFPESRHRLCLWHIRKKFPEKLAHIYHKKSIFKRDLKRVIRDSPNVQSFEEGWRRLIIEYKLEENEWLQGLYKIRESWIPIYNRRTFFAGMNTTQRSESINSFFYSFVDATTTLQEFVVKYEKAVDSRLEVERREDYESRHKSRHKSRILTIGSKLEDHAALIYTRNIFGKFQDELAKINRFTKLKMLREGTRCKYQVSNNFVPQDTFMVDIDLNSKIANCGCQLFESMGILCRHILVIFQSKGVLQIPDHFILQRWTKDANKEINFSDTEYDFDNHSDTPKILRRVHTQQETNVLVDLAEESIDIYKYIILELMHIRVSALKMKACLSNGDGLDPLESGHSNMDEILSIEEGSKAAQMTIGDSHISQTKGRKKDGDRISQNSRLKSGLEISLNRFLVKRKACHECGEHGHNSRTCKKKEY